LAWGDCVGRKKKKTRKKTRKKRRRRRKRKRKTPPLAALDPPKGRVRALFGELTLVDGLEE
jgi:hypothetical protein